MCSFRCSSPAISAGLRRTVCSVEAEKNSGTAGGTPCTSTTMRPPSGVSEVEALAESEDFGFAASAAAVANRAASAREPKRRRVEWPIGASFIEVPSFGKCGRRGRMLGNSERVIVADPRREVVRGRSEVCQGDVRKRVSGRSDPTDRASGGGAGFTPARRMRAGMAGVKPAPPYGGGAPANGGPTIEDGSAELISPAASGAARTWSPALGAACRRGDGRAGR